MNKYLATDLDGTLLYPKIKSRYVCKQNRDLVNKFNGNVIIVSGRGKAFINRVCKELNIEQTYIGCNGAIICHKGKDIQVKFLDLVLVNEIIAYVKSNCSNYKIILFDKEGKLYSLSNDNQSSSEQERAVLNNFPKHGYWTIKSANKINKLLSQNNSITKLDALISDEEKMKLYHYLINKKYSFSYAFCKAGLEFTAHNTSKGSSLKTLTEHMKINPNDVFVTGDEANDISMLEAYQNSFLINHKNNLHLSNKAQYVVDNFKDIGNYIKED